MELLQLARRIDPELVGEQFARAVEGGKGIGLAAGAVERQHSCDHRRSRSG